MKDKNVSELRRQHNYDLIRKMRAGDSLTSFDSRASWFPPRPVIEKDVREMARVYQSGEPNERTATIAARTRAAAPAAAPLRVLAVDNKGDELSAIEGPDRSA